MYFVKCQTYAHTIGHHWEWCRHTKKCFAKDYGCRTSQLTGHYAAKDSDILPEHAEREWNIDFWKFNEKTPRCGFASRKRCKKHLWRRFDNLVETIVDCPLIEVASAHRELALRGHHTMQIVHRFDYRTTRIGLTIARLPTFGNRHWLIGVEADQRKKQCRKT